MMPRRQETAVHDDAEARGLFRAMLRAFDDTHGSATPALPRLLAQSHVAVTIG